MLWTHDKKAMSLTAKKERREDKTEAAGANKKEKTDKTRESVWRFQPYCSDFYWRPLSAILVGKMHGHTDLKSPSTSESSEINSWGTFLLFRRCSSLLFCGEGLKKYQQTVTVGKDFFQWIILKDKRAEFNVVLNIIQMYLPFWVPPLPQSSVSS